MMHTLLRLPALLALAVLAWAGNTPALAAPYTGHTDGTVTDTATGLMWDKCSSGQSGNTDCTDNGNAGNHYGAGAYTWQQALTLAVTANAANYKGHNDWRLPNVKELESIVNMDATISPTIDTAAFPNTIGEYYWSSTPYIPTSGVPQARLVYFFGGDLSSDDQTNGGYYVRLVRSGQSFAAFDALAAAPTATPTAVPTLSEWGLVALAMLVAGAAALGLRRRE